MTIGSVCKRSIEIIILLLAFAGLESRIFPITKASLVFNLGFRHLHLAVGTSSYLVELLVNSRTNLFLAVEMGDEKFKLNFGDLWVNFGRGLVLGNNKYNYFTKLLHLSALSTNGILHFNYSHADRNFDGIVDIRKGVGVEFDKGVFGGLFILFDYGSILSDYVIGGVIGVDEVRFMVCVHSNLFFSANHKSSNLMGLGVVSDFELATRVSTNGIGWALGVSLEWYYRKFRFLVDARVLEPNFYSPFTSSMFSRNRSMSGIVFSGELDEKEVKLSHVNKLAFLHDSSVENDFYLSLIRKLVPFTFINLEVLKDSSQEKLFFSVFPFFKFKFLSLFSKPVFCLDEKLHFNRVELGGRVEVCDFRVKLSVFLPMSVSGTYTFVSSEVRDLFGENIDIKVSDDDGPSAVLSFVMSQKDVNTEVMLTWSYERGFGLGVVLSIGIM